MTLLRRRVVKRFPTVALALCPARYLEPYSSHSLQLTSLPQ